MTVIQKSSPTVKGVKTTTSDCTERRHSSSSPCKMSQNGSSGYYEGDVLLDDDALVSMPEATLIECFGNLAVTKRPAHLRPPAAFCLPFVSMNNDLTSGHALKHITLTSVFDALHPYVAMPYINRMDICSAMNVYWIRNCLEAEQSDLFHRFALEMQVHLSACFGCRVVLDIYGSTRNGFGTRFCDVDMSLSFSPSPPSWATNSDRVMRAVAKALVDFPKAVDERYVNAKVPIVRFRSSDMDMEADISYKNDLALHNTQLLQQYCKWDPERLPTLGVWVKAWAKRSGVGDASKGSLSSYAWIVMLIHYLQQVEPIPVLPCLQEMNHQKSENVYVQGYNTYYWKFVDTARTRRCRASVVDLFVGFLDYYATYFDYSTNVIQMVSKKLEFKPDRWCKYPMCIADPFETDHNLAQGVDMPMFEYIRSCMEHSKKVFTDRRMRSEFLSGYGFDVDEFDARHRGEMNMEMASQFGEFLLHKCIMVKQAPNRQFRDRSMSQSTSISNTSSISSSG
ncbi:PAP-associated domain-containing protein [Caenorhabditis elegans]|uniref:PAP-associated domain-containing protein n=1 Tax=Caenorhabditis elegans TaxID=6239 RepID=Q09408_CAEEL|nr:PAP-associated domain-containing protein [Caenorhabditis elegans]CCD72857.1 PAP-associated domain-containing protein [Caenorhabditis elegans]|eukprot:NP_498100.1 Poly(U) Polymerase [Caenorhabditis elegans]